MANPMKIRATLRGAVTDVKVLMQHVMETGQRRDELGEVVPAHFIQTVTVSYSGATVLSAEWGPAISRHPFLSCTFRGGARGETVQIQWIDNQGAQSTDETIIQ
ncbi:MAG: thiosulfate oxidation carrier complex protein SoxZ [Candidatus Tectomicrobia bacterium]|uniref:Thiosulfate oxidation carrier complex protein SoxZ n=1 Tax=Tectimicrobiota bacterium TaxID=2528274 RepID=A0A937W3B6_UNCTE|nr:thiosulfate oxidation carrier complex protein SoxZ [Candidatus Tectomicrobia bacterium]